MGCCFRYRMTKKKGWFIQGLENAESTTIEPPPNYPESTSFGTTPNHAESTTFHFGAEQMKIIADSVLFRVFLWICAILICIFSCMGKILILKNISQ